MYVSCGSVCVEFDPLQRWDTGVNLAEGTVFTGAPNGYATPFQDLPPPSNRVALLIDRFAHAHRTATVLHCSNDSLFPTEFIFKQNLFNFIPEKQDKENLIRTMDLVKRWITTGVDGPTAGSFATCRFTLHIPLRQVTSIRRKKTYFDSPLFLFFYTTAQFRNRRWLAF